MELEFCLHVLLILHKTMGYLKPFPGDLGHKAVGFPGKIALKVKAYVLIH